MTPRKRLDETLSAWADADPLRDAVAATILCLADGAVKLSGLLAAGPLAGNLGAVLFNGEAGEEQKALDVQAQAIFTACLRAARVAAIASEEAPEAIPLTPDAPLLVALDPLDGSSNIDTGLTVGSIFSILPRGTAVTLEHEFLAPRHHAIGRGLCALRPAYGADAQRRRRHGSLRSGSGKRHVPSGAGRAANPPEKAEFAINMSNYRHWDDNVRAYINDCLNGRTVCSKPISTCAGSPAWSPRRTAFSIAAASISTPPTRGKVMAAAGCG